MEDKCGLKIPDDALSNLGNVSTSFYFIMTGVYEWHLFQMSSESFLRFAKHVGLSLKGEMQCHIICDYFSYQLAQGTCKA